MTVFTGWYMQMRRMLWRELVFICPNREVTRTQSSVNYLIIASVIWTILSTEDDLFMDLGIPALEVEILFSVIFLIEYLARLIAAGEDPRFRGFIGRLRWMRRISSVMDMVAIAPPLLFSGMEASLILRLFRIFRVIRLSRMSAFARGLDLLQQVISERKSDLLAAIAIAGMLLLLSASALYLVEGDIQPEAFGSIPRAAWWAIATLTTVGYGDVYPLTLLGRLVGGVSALAGIGIIAMPTGILSAAISDALARSRKSGDDSLR